MARQPMVTRTIITTKVKALCVDTEKQETLEKEYILPRTYKDTSTLLKALKKRVDVDENGNETTIKAVHIIASEEIETLYGMTEDKFIANAEVLPPRASNTNETEN